MCRKGPETDDCPVIGALGQSSVPWCCWIPSARQTGQNLCMAPPAMASVASAASAVAARAARPLRRVIFSLPPGADRGQAVWGYRGCYGGRWETAWSAHHGERAA
jgi:hypothetical protein